MKNLFFLIIAVALIITSCGKTETPAVDKGPKLIFKFKFDSTQERLNNFGNPAGMKPGNWGQSPIFHSMSAHYLELAPDSLTQIGHGDILFKATEVGTSPNNAIDFSKSKFAGNNEEFYSVPLKNVTAGTYKWIRVSLAYQNYDIKVLYKNSTLPAPYNNMLLDGRIASFVGFNTYITNYKVKDQTLTINGNRKQGYGAFELFNLPSGIPAQAPRDWQAPAVTTTTVPNPIANTSPIPQGSCVVTGRFANTGLTITGNETEDIVVIISLSTKQSFEWRDMNGDHLYQPLQDGSNTLIEDSVVDMGLRGLIPIIQ
jgi:hypothetical protein